MNIPRTYRVVLNKSDGIGPEPVGAVLGVALRLDFNVRGRNIADAEEKAAK